MNTRRYPRTLQEAFGPYTDHRLQPMPQPLDRADRIVLWGCAVAAFAFVVLFIAERSL